MRGFISTSLANEKSIIIIVVILLNLCIVNVSHAQLPSPAQSPAEREKVYDPSSFSWLGFYTKYRIGEKLWYNGEYHIRRRGDFINEMAQLYVRIGLSYLVKNNFEITGGIVTPLYWADKENYPNEVLIDNVLPQFRFWQQYLFIQSVGRTKLYHQIRTEQRWRRDFIKDSPFLLTHRFRYKIMAYIPLSSRGLQINTMYVSMYNEIFIQAGKSIKLNYMEDNRTFVGIGYILNENIQLQAGYMKSLQQQANGYDLNNRDILRFSFYHNMDFYYKRKGKGQGNIAPIFD